MFILTFPVGKLKQEGFKMVWVLARIWTWKIWLISRPMLKWQTISSSYAIFFNKDKTLCTLIHVVRNGSLMYLELPFLHGFWWTTSLIHALCSWQICHLFLFSSCLKGSVPLCSRPFNFRASVVLLQWIQDSSRLWQAMEFTHLALS